MTSAKPPSFTVSKNGYLPAPPAVVAKRIFSADADSIRALTTLSGLCVESSFVHRSSEPTHIPSPAAFADAVAQEQDFLSVTADHPANGESISIYFAEKIPLFPVKIPIEATWTFLGEGAEDRRAGVYKSTSAKAGVRVTKIRTLKEEGEGTRLTEEANVWCPWGIGGFSKGVTEKGLQEFVETMQEWFKN